jgi:Coenzyme PQQ synthesis protein D (PqqD)
VQLRNGQLSWREFDGETVVLDLAGSKYLTVNEAGTVLLKLLADGCTRDGLVQALVDRFGISNEQAGIDVDAFVAKLGQKGLLETD